MGKITKLTIEAYEKPNFTGSAGSMELQVNPETISHTHGISFKSPSDSSGGGSGTGAPGGPEEFDKFEPETISFDFYFDATGVIPNCTDVMAKVSEFKKLAYNYSGKIHGPHYLKLVWGSKSAFWDQNRIFRCRLKSLSISYNLFKPDGAPLRAKLSASFSQYLTQEESNKIANKNSPDLTHVRTIREGDRLAMICEEIYGDPSYYLQVARLNGLTNISQLTPGTQISFPPISKS